jgi:hypothetical protein
MVTVRGKAETQRYMAQLPAKLDGVVRGAARAGGKVLAEGVKQRTPSEEVRENVRIRTRKSDDQITVTVDVKPGWARSIATWLEYGTSPHFISVDDSQRRGMSVGRINQRANDPDSSHSLVIGGKFVGATVFHPGARPHPAFRPALDADRDDAIAAAQSYINGRVKRSGIIASADAGDGE